MNEHPTLDMELENNLTADMRGVFLTELHRSLQAFRNAVSTHLKTGLNPEEYEKWDGLRSAALLAEDIATRTRQQGAD